MAVDSHVADGVRYIRFNRPEKLNALTTADLAEVTRLVTDPDDRTRALVFSGAGGRSFSAGMHVDTFAGLDPAQARQVIRQVRDCLRAVRTSPVPTVAMINGYCLGAGFELALACDLRISVDSARFGLPEVKVGIPSVVDAALLQQYVGLGMAKEIILTGDLYEASELLQRGLLNRVVPEVDLRAATGRALARVTAHTPTVLASQKRLFEIWQNVGLKDGIDASVEEFARVFEAPETARRIEEYHSSIGRRHGSGG